MSGASGTILQPGPRSKNCRCGGYKIVPLTPSGVYRMDDVSILANWDEKRKWSKRVNASTITSVGHYSYDRRDSVSLLSGLPLRQSAPADESAVCRASSQRLPRRIIAVLRSSYWISFRWTFLLYQILRKRKRGAWCSRLSGVCACSDYSVNWLTDWIVIPSPMEYGSGATVTLDTTGAATSIDAVRSIK